MARYALRVKMKSGHQVVNSLSQDSTIKELKQTLSNLSNIPVNKLCILFGFPPKVLDTTQDNSDLGSCGLLSGDTLILEEKVTPVEDRASSVNKQKGSNLSAEDYLSIQENEDGHGILMKFVVPADNSCLFTSIHFVLNGKVDESGSFGPHMRKLVAETIKGDKHNYDEAILGKPVDEYCTWIQNDTSWGGAIELSILANYYGIEIAVVDIVNGIINKFGEDQNYPLRVFLLFDGIHYDPLYMEPIDGGNNQTIFPTDNVKVLRDAEQLAQEAKSSRQFTDVDKFTLKCMVCSIHLKGQVAAQEHAHSTGHTNFGEV